SLPRLSSGPLRPFSIRNIHPPIAGRGGKDFAYIRSIRSPEYTQTIEILRCDKQFSLRRLQSGQSFRIAGYPKAAIPSRDVRKRSFSIAKQHNPLKRIITSRENFIAVIITNSNNVEVPVPVNIRSNNSIQRGKLCG